ncbi:MAG: phosphate acyltransferase PlsX [Elusimicrobiota bacterium]|jgi:glycerol-3-phosphate acyltransferase PlsX|nr:phosphate acyltransferase PlsX [Elusimicrobiota bacterium]
MKIALDVMGGDNAPQATVEGAILASKETNAELILVGDENQILDEMSKFKSRIDLTKLNLEIIHTTEVITMHDHPAKAVRNKKDSSLSVCAKLVAQGEAAGFVSMGNSGAVMAAALFYLKRLDGVLRPTIITRFPSLNGSVCIADMGANVDCKPENLLQFAIMTNIFCRKVLGMKDPRVGLVSIGEEPTKGNELSLAAYQLLAKADLNFIGNIEGYDIPSGKADIVVCDGFVGNVILKFGEGLSDMILKLIYRSFKKHPISWASIPFLWPTLNDLRKKVDYSEFGGVPLLGVDGVCIIGHGKSNAKAVKNAIIAAINATKYDVAKAISEALGKNGKADE